QPIGVGSLETPALLAVVLEGGVLLAVQLLIADLEKGVADLDKRLEPALDDDLQLLEPGRHHGAGRPQLLRGRLGRLRKLPAATLVPDVVVGRRPLRAAFLFCHGRCTRSWPSASGISARARAMRFRMVVVNGVCRCRSLLRVSSGISARWPNPVRVSPRLTI